MLRHDITIIGNQKVVMSMVWFDLIQFDVKWCDVMWCDVMWCDVMWCDVMWCDVMWCDVMWCDMMWCDVMWCDVIWCHVMSCHDMSCHDMSYDIILCYINAQVYDNDCSGRYVCSTCLHACTHVTRRASLRRGEHSGKLRQAMISGQLQPTDVIVGTES